MARLDHRSCLSKVDSQASPFKSPLSNGPCCRPSPAESTLEVPIADSRPWPRRRPREGQADPPTAGAALLKENISSRGVPVDWAMSLDCFGSKGVTVSKLAG